ncbi:acetate--CoA ligase family protein [Pseudomonas sp. BN414]|uniref:acetate--CoA ligase family protein n=1 Tax=Pseudomonas sp. BN414 TaxID=2567888 RepID=UPI002454EA01|nr:acetate--CoA ligase family protein [Pseudomonas sp. BN414]MDH4565202.1 acetate--CoA ligase family protein [Pseudomonas sp. BN414]
MELEKLFRPRSVAIIGASDKNPWSALVAKSLQALNFDGSVHLVNRRGTDALSKKTVQSCSELRNVDAAFIAVPAVALLDAIEDMAAGGIRFGAVVTSGFAETGEEGAVEQARIFERARELGITLIGPNSLGFSNFVDNVSLSAIPIKLPTLESPRVGLVSQSGATAAMISAFAHQQGVSLSYSIAMGNEAMVDMADVIQFLVDDQATRAIAVFAESIRDPQRFESAARAAVCAGKPIVILKIGTGELTATVAQAHTGALVGDDRVFQAVCDAYNIVRVSSLEDLVVTADLLAATGPIDTSKGFALVSPSGGACEIFADRGEEAGISFPQFAPVTLESLSRLLPDFGTAHNPLDVTGAVMRNPEIYSGAIKALSQDPGIGFIGVVVEIPSSPETASPMSAGYMREVSQGFLASGARGCLIQQILKPVTAYGLDLLKANDLPALTGGIDHAVRAIGNLYQWSRNQGCELPAERSRSTASQVKPGTERETLAFLDSVGVPVIPQRVVSCRADAEAAAQALEGPLVLKILSPDIQHKTEVGGVLLNLVGLEAVGEGFDRIMGNVQTAKPNARIEGVIVSPMRQGGVELLVGVARDPVWGLVLAVGLGGVWVELLGDTQLRLLPVSADEAKGMLCSLKAHKLLTGYRGAKPADLDELSRVIARIGDAALALGGELDALEINPLRVDGAAVEALDALAIWRAKQQ